VTQVKEKFILHYQPVDPAQVKGVIGCSSHKHLLQEVKEKTEGLATVRAS
jgi:hypothetical protein